ncbi:MAG: AAA family ATPase [Candidatus Diapherotrites archaeon]|nr:AAA family ATPase [Candidatus Diapherotrites archaeon]
MRVCMTNLFSRGKKEHTLFKDERVLYPEFVPEQLLHRERQLEEFAFAFKPLTQGGRPENVFVFGPTGTGKTVSMRLVLRDLEGFSDRVKSKYLNCFEFNSRQSVLTELAAFLGVPVPRRGVGVAEAYAQFLEGLKRASFVPVVVLDEFDQLFFREGNALLYDLLRTSEQTKKFVGVVLISNDAHLPLRFEDRVRSSFSRLSVAFDAYTPMQLKDILRERSEKAFVGHGVGEEVIPLIAGHAARKGGDCRIAIEALLKAGRIAERANASSIQVPHARQAFAAMESPLKKSMERLSDSERVVLQCILDWKGESISSGQLYELLQTAKGLGERRTREVLAKLESLKLVTLTWKELEGRGRTRVIALALPRNVVMKELA